MLGENFLRNLFLRMNDPKMSYFKELIFEDDGYKRFCGINFCKLFRFIAQHFVKTNQTKVKNKFVPVKKWKVCGFIFAKLGEVPKKKVPHNFVSTNNFSLKVTSHPHTIIFT